MAPIKKGFGPTASEIVNYRGKAAELLDKDRVDSFLRLTKDNISRNKINEPSSSKKKRFIQRDSNFSCDLKKHLCCAKTGPNLDRKCSRIVVRGIFLCWQHTKSIYKIRMDKSTLSNTNMNGLFACKPISKGSEIVPYFGEILNYEENESRYPGGNAAPYSVEVTSKTKYVDSACMQGTGGFGNQASGGRRNNAQIRKTRVTYPRIVSTKKINAGQEILVNYGSDYVFSDSGFEPTEKVYRRKPRGCS